MEEEGRWKGRSREGEKSYIRGALEHPGSPLVLRIYAHQDGSKASAIKQKMKRRKGRGRMGEGEEEVEPIEHLGPASGLDLRRLYFIPILKRFEPYKIIYKNQIYFSNGRRKEGSRAADPFASRSHRGKISRSHRFSNILVILCHLLRQPNIQKMIYIFKESEGSRAGGREQRTLIVEVE